MEVGCLFQNIMKRNTRTGCDMQTSISQFHLWLCEIWGSHSSKSPGSDALCWVGGYRHFGGACCLDLHGRRCWEEDQRYATCLSRML